jgi:hypothetical protein
LRANNNSRGCELNERASIEKATCYLHEGFLFGGTGWSLTILVALF